MSVLQRYMVDLTCRPANALHYDIQPVEDAAEFIAPCFGGSKAHTCACPVKL